MFKNTLVIGCMCLCFAAFSQADNPLEIAQTYLDENYKSLELLEQDVRNWKLSSQVVSAHNKVTHVYLEQHHENIPVHNAIFNLNIKEDGIVFAPGNRFVADLAGKVNTTTPSMEPLAAVTAVMDHFRLPGKEQLQAGQEQTPNHWVFPHEGIALEPIEVKLKYVSLPEQGMVRLTWNVTFYTLDGQHWWQARVDALTGEMLDFNDQVVRCEFDHNHHHHHHVEAPSIPSIHAGNASLTTLLGSGDVTPVYNVFPLFIESPNHGDRALVVDPADTTASPFGWHDIDGEEGAEFTITRGNNVHAYQDILANNASIGDEPDGGDSLVFDFPLSFDPPRPYTQLDPATTNLFYWNNLMHDVWYYYGFDEQAGNFQEINYTGVAAGSDYVAAEALDGSGTNNANFGTPTDGNNPRMQMFLWGGSLQNGLEVLAPQSVAGFYQFVGANFGGTLPEDDPLTGLVVLANDGVGDNADVCQPIINATELAGNIAMVNRGTCEFGAKALAVEQAGAVAVIVCQNNPDQDIFDMDGGVVGDQVTIPAVMMSLQDCEELMMGLPDLEVRFQGGVPQPGPTGRDSDFDNGVIVHEYGHGISNRLTGGRNQSGCLSQDNDEQAGEGWSDWLALVMTTTPANNANEGRGIGTYSSGEQPTGGGIRPFPYSRDMVVNPHTYADVNSVSIPHGVGSVWCVMIWDMYWNLVDEYGFDPDIYHGTGGNNIAMQLVMDGMKIQACDPDFIDSRDAIIEADQVNNQGANYCLIWETFARRGLGASAAPGGSEAFDLPFNCPPALTVQKFGPMDAIAGENIPYELSIVNGRSNTVADVLVTDVIPEGTTLVEGSSSCEVTVDGNQLSFSVGEAVTGASFTCTYELATDPGFGSRFALEDPIANRANWDEVTDVGDQDWTLRVNDAYTGMWSLIARNVPERADMSQVLAEPITLTGTRPGLTFWHKYRTEISIDGGVVEISTDGGDNWTDVGAESFVLNGYNDTLQSTDNPLANRAAFSGTSPNWIRSIVDLSAYAGESVLIRFRFGCNTGGERLGWILDDINIYHDLFYIENVACTSTEGEEFCSSVVTILNEDITINTNDVLTQQALTLYPNPVTQELSVSVPTVITEPVTVSLHSLNGAELMVKNFTSFTRAQLDVSNLPDGMYMLRFQTNDDIVTKRVIKQR